MASDAMASATPSISRRITACETCRKHKIKCDMRNAQPPCSRCKRQGLPCTLNRNLQTLLEEGDAWKRSTDERIAQLEATVGLLSQRLASEQPRDDLEQQQHRHHALGPPAASHSDQPADAAADPMDLSTSNPVPAHLPPSFAQTAAADWRAAADSSARDLIARGIVSPQTAGVLFDYYQQHLDPFLYNILGHRTTLLAVRASSSLLTAAVCTVGALHCSAVEPALFKRCLNEYSKESAAKSFSKHNNLDDVRAFCIGGFWLNDISWILVGAAVRISTEIRLNMTLRPALRGDRDSYEALRVYYLVFVCEHHSSIAHGRPPLTRQCHAIRKADKLLDSEFATENDARLVSQIKLWRIASDIAEEFGEDVFLPLLENQYLALRRYNIALDSWRGDWSDRFAPNPHVGNYPNKGIGLHYHFAKLYLCSHVFRGLTPGKTHSNVPRQELSEFANTALMAARSILETITLDVEFQQFLDGLPVYFNTMIAFAAVFAVKSIREYSEYLMSSTQEVLELVGRASEALKRLVANHHAEHLLHAIANGMEDLVKKAKNEQFDITQDNNGILPGYEQDTPAAPMSSLDVRWDSLEQPFLANFDFLSDSNLISGLDNFPLGFDDL